MKKAFLTLVAILSIAGLAHADAPLGTVRRLINAQTINATGNTVTTVAIPVKSAGYFGIWYQATSASSTPDVKIQYEMAYSDTPNTIFAEPVTASDVVTNLTSEAVQIESIQPPPMPYMRIKFEGNSANATDTTVTAYLFSQE